MNAGSSNTDAVGFWRVFRTWGSHPVSRDPNAWLVLCHVSDKARYAPIVEGEPTNRIQPGESDLTQEQICLLTGLKLKAVQGAIKRLQRWGAVTVRKVRSEIRGQSRVIYRLQEACPCTPLGTRSVPPKEAPKSPKQDAVHDLPIGPTQASASDGTVDRACSPACDTACRTACGTACDGGCGTACNGACGGACDTACGRHKEGHAEGIVFKKEKKEEVRRIRERAHTRANAHTDAREEQSPCQIDAPVGLEDCVSVSTPVGDAKPYQRHYEVPPPKPVEIPEVPDTGNRWDDAEVAAQVFYDALPEYRNKAGPLEPVQWFQSKQRADWLKAIQMARWLAEASRDVPGAELDGIKSPVRLLSGGWHLRGRESIRAAVAPMRDSRPIKPRAGESSTQAVATDAEIDAEVEARRQRRNLPKPEGGKAA